MMNVRRYIQDRGRLVREPGHRYLKGLVRPERTLPADALWALGGQDISHADCTNRRDVEKLLMFISDERARCAVRARYFRDQLYEQIAETLGVSRESARQLANKGIAEMRAALVDPRG